MGEEISADVRFHPDAKGVTPVANHIVEHTAQHIGRHHHPHGQEEHPVGPVRQPRIQSLAGHQGEGQINDRHQKGAEHIQEKQPQMGLKVGEKNPQRAFRSIILGGHILPFLACYTNSGSIIPVFSKDARTKRQHFAAATRRNAPEIWKFPGFSRCQGGPALQHGTL